MIPSTADRAVSYAAQLLSIREVRCSYRQLNSGYCQSVHKSATLLQ